MNRLDNKQAWNDYLRFCKIMIGLNLIIGLLGVISYNYVVTIFCIAFMMYYSYKHKQARMDMAERFNEDTDIEP